MEFAVEKLGEKDIRKLQARVHTPDDKMAIMLEEHNQRNPERPLSLEAFKAHLLEVYEKQGAGRTKSLRTEQMSIGSNIEDMGK